MNKPFRSNKMKSIKTLISFIILAAVLISACASSSAAATSAGTSDAATQDSGSILPDSARLIAGSLKLTQIEGTFTAKEAEQMLVLWQAYKELQSRDTAAEQ
jgi:Skp family chaperone for outer membrane proteins